MNINQAVTSVMRACVGRKYRYRTSDIRLYRWLLTCVASLLQGHAAAKRFVTKSAMSKFTENFQRHYNLFLINTTVFLVVTPSGLVGSHISTKLKGSYPKTSFPHPENLIPLTSDLSPTRRIILKIQFF
jgi:hypothetical protein